MALWGFDQNNDGELGACPISSVCGRGIGGSGRRLQHHVGMMGMWIYDVACICW